jgi:transcriptional regulator with XRE-family HTH domain
MQAKRQRLAERRRRCGYSQEALAEQLRVDRTSIGRWERGETDPQPHIRPRLASLLKMTQADLDVFLFPRASIAKEMATERVTPSKSIAVFSLRQNELDTGGFDEMIRREFLQLTSITSALLAAQQLEPQSKKHHATLSADINNFTRMNAHLWQVFSLTKSKHAVYPVVRDQLVELNKSLAASKSEASRQELCAIAGSLFQIAGEIFFDRNRYTDAAHCYTLAASASKEVKKFDLWACALTRHSFIGVYGSQTCDVSPLLTAAQLVAKRGDTQLATRYWIFAVQAHVFARHGDYDSCTRALDEAEHVHSLTENSQPDGWLRFDGSRLSEERGACYVALGRGDLAESALINALKLPLSPRRKASVLTDLATLGAQRHDLDQLSSFTDSAIKISEQTHSGYVGRKLHNLQAQLKPLITDRRIADVYDRISTLNSAEQNSQRST